MFHCIHNHSNIYTRNENENDTFNHDVEKESEENRSNKVVGILN